MNSIISLGNSLYNMYLQNNEQVSSTQDLAGDSLDNSELQPLDSSNFSQQGLQLLSNSTQNTPCPLDNLVSNGTITQVQENTVNSVFQAALQFNSSGSYGSSPLNPIAALVSNGTITQDQATAISNAYLSYYQSNQSGTQISSQSTSNTVGSISNNTADSLTDNGLTSANQNTSMEDAFDSLLSDSQSDTLADYL